MTKSVNCLFLISLLFILHPRSFAATPENTQSKSERNRYLFCAAHDYIASQGAGERFNLLYGALTKQSKEKGMDFESARFLNYHMIKEKVGFISGVSIYNPNFMTEVYADNSCGSITIQDASSP